MDELSGQSVAKGIGMSLLTLAGIFLVILGLITGWISLIGVALLGLSLYLTRDDTSRFAKMNKGFKVVFMVFGIILAILGFLG